MKWFSRAKGASAKNTEDMLNKKIFDLEHQIGELNANLYHERSNSERLADHLRAENERERIAHNETRVKYAEALKELIEIREQLARKDGKEA